MKKKYIFKLLTAGEGGVGKTTLLRRYIDNVFEASTKMTIGVEFFIKELLIDSNQCSLQLWDFAGQEQFRFMLDAYVIGAKGALLMFDLTRLMTLKNLEEWINIVRSRDPNLPVIFIGTKLDLQEKITVDDDYALQFIDQFNLIDYIKISSKTGENVNSAFDILVRNILDKTKQ